MQEALALCDEIGFEDGKAWPIVLLAQARRWSGDESPEVREMLLDARRRFVETGETYGQIHADMLLGSCYEFPPQERLRFGEEMVELSARPGGENLMRPIALHNVAYPLHELGEHERANEFNRAAVRSSVATGATMDLGLALIQAATFAAADGPPDRVVRLAAAGRGDLPRRRKHDSEYCPKQHADQDRDTVGVVEENQQHPGDERARRCQEQGVPGRHHRPQARERRCHHERRS